MKRTHRYIIAILINLFIFSGESAKAQSLVSTDSLSHLVKEAYIYGYSVEQCYRMYVTMQDNIGQSKRLDVQLP